MNKPKVTVRAEHSEEDQDPNGTGNQFVFNLRLLGQYGDVETGLFQNCFRDYDPSTGRYPENDPKGLKGGSFSTYTYVNGNPLRFADPTGVSTSSSIQQFCDTKSTVAPSQRCIGNGNSIR